MSNSVPPFLSMGHETFRVSLGDVFGANRKKLVAELRTAGHDTGAVFLMGGPAETRFDSDHELMFRQESYMFWLTGVKEPDCAVCINVSDGSTVLFIPKLPADYATVMGRIKEPHEWTEAYMVDNVMYTEDIGSYLDTLMTNAPTNGHKPKLYLMLGVNSDSGTMFEPPVELIRENTKLAEDQVDTDALFPLLAECRVFKSPAEMGVLQHVTEVTSFAHAYVMRNFKAGMSEYQGESLFRHYCYYNYGCRIVGYTPICGCGPNAATLHYGHAGEPNARQSQSGEMALFDMGAEYFGYGSDVTCSFPVNGKFDADQRAIYEGVLQAQIAVYDMIKPGVSYVDCHKKAEAVILEALVDLGIVVPGCKSVEDLVEMRLGAVFMPHGLGHFIGIDTHDVGGYLPGHPERSPLPGLAKLRTARILQAGMTLTVEPGCYFIEHLMDAATAEDSPLRPFLNEARLNEFRGWGGVRLEDVLVVTDEGCVNYTLCPRTVTEVEGVMAGGKWPPITDSSPELRRKRLTDPTPLPSPPSA